MTLAGTGRAQSSPQYFTRAAQDKGVGLSAHLDMLSTESRDLPVPSDEHLLQVSALYSQATPTWKAANSSALSLRL